MAALDGYHYLMRLASTTVSGTVSGEITKTWDMIDTTTKDSSQEKEYTVGESGWTGSIEGKVDESDAYTIDSLHTVGDNRTAVAFLAARNATGSLSFSGNVFLSSLSFSAPKNGEVTYTAELQGTGSLTVGTTVGTFA